MAIRFLKFKLVQAKVQFKHFVAVKMSALLVSFYYFLVKSINHVSHLDFISVIISFYQLG